jgi:hypothetical protein
LAIERWSGRPGSGNKRVLAYLFVIKLVEDAAHPIMHRKDGQSGSNQFWHVSRETSKAFIRHQQQRHVRLALGQKQKA